MILNRSQRRKMERNKLHISRELRKEVLQRTEKQLNDGRVEAMMLCFALAMHRELGFGKGRCMKMLKAVDDLMNQWICGECDLELMRQWTLEEVGIDVKC